MTCTYLYATKTHDRTVRCQPITDLKQLQKVCVQRTGGGTGRAADLHQGIHKNRFKELKIVVCPPLMNKEQTCTRVLIPGTFSGHFPIIKCSDTLIN